MSEQRPPEAEPGSLTPPEQPSLPAQPAAWMPPPPVQPAPPATPGSVWSRVAAFVVLVAVVAAAGGAGIGWSIASAVNHRQVAQSTITPEAPIQQVTPGTGNANNGSSSIAAIVAKVSPSVVDINTTVGTGQAAGTGMIVSSTGEILTNNHVVTGSTSITVTVQGRSQRYSAHVVGVNVSQDVAVIQIDDSVSGLPTVRFANSSSLKVGDQVVAIGNALGRGGAPHSESGQVTNLDQTITASTGGSNAETLSGMIESDALIYEGDSGGALVNSAGQVVGMITAGQAQGFRSAASNVGYAIAANTAVGIVNQIRAHVQSSDLTYGQVGFLGVSVRNATTGALVTGAQAGSPAENAGITAGSVITKIGGTTIDSSDTLGIAIRSHKPGDQVQVTWSNSSGTHTATVTLAGVNP